MALAEARAAWQRTANRCLVQEDAKRAPKLACCSSASPSVKPFDAGPGGVADGQDTPSIGCLPLNRNYSYSNLSPNSRWWLQNQPNYGYQNSLMNEQFNASEANMETCGTFDSSRVHVRNEDDAGLVDQIRHVESIRDNQCRIFPTSEKKDFRVNDTENFQDPLKLEDTEDQSELTNIGAVDREVSKKSNEFCFDSEGSWIAAKKNDPWWRTADTEELAVLVAHRSLDLIGNCDLPQPQHIHDKKDVNVNLCCFGSDGIDTSSLDPKPESCYNLTSHVPGSFSAEIPYKKHRLSAEGELLSSSDKRSSDNPTDKWMPEMHNSENDQSKAQLLEALCHSQTRAREAEKAAKRACAEKEHIVQLVFRQASQLFAYKQWFQLLQLENIYFQIKNNKSQPISTIFPLKLPLVPQKTKKMRNSWHKSGRGKQGKQSRPQHDISRYAVIFALGLGLVSAGFFIGWTVGCMLPSL
ncbi:unnamed protein product [Fraxinus pennsylvanica]|uniref:Uncharacterized protein n=1 Tax=Fraxinus pennsylvanica TaxID=56036 RepID=A0AAD2DS05_9LAMI|nr:unnamed protein product [Fraxinus pennsylvanica]